MKYYIVIVLVSLAFTLSAQSPLPVKPKNTNHLIELQKNKSKLPKSFFGGIEGDSLTLFSEIALVHGFKDYKKQAYSLNDFDYITIKNKKAHTIGATIAGTVVGIGSFLIAKNLAKEEDNLNINILNQPGRSGIVEGVLAGTAGAGLGVLFYNVFANKKHDLTKDKEKVKKKLGKIKF